MQKPSIFAFLLVSLIVLSGCVFSRTVSHVYEKQYLVQRMEYFLEDEKIRLAALAEKIEESKHPAVGLGIGMSEHLPIVKIISNEHARVAGITEGDAIIEANGARIQNGSDFKEAVGTSDLSAIGTPVLLRVMRKDDTEFSATVRRVLTRVAYPERIPSIEKAASRTHELLENYILWKEALEAASPDAAFPESAVFFKIMSHLETLIMDYRKSAEYELDGIRARGFAQALDDKRAYPPRTAKSTR